MHGWIMEELSNWIWVWKSSSYVERLELRLWGYDKTHNMAALVRTCLLKVNSLVYKSDTFSIVPACLLRLP